MMRTVRIPKRNGDFRTIVVPDHDTKLRLRKIASEIATKASRLPTAVVVHGFTRGRNPVTNALAHVGRRFTLSFDLKDFFDSVTEEKLRGKLSATELQNVLYEGRAAQGLPSSPAVANVAAADMDKALLRAIERAGATSSVVYTRYADDLTFSFNDYDRRAWLLATVPAVAARCGFRVNERKTHFQRASFGRRIITGIGVDDRAIYPTRSMKRRLRAALHQRNEVRARGLAEVLKCKMPRVEGEPASHKPRVTVNLDEAKSLAAAWGLALPPAHSIPAKDETTDGDFLVTGDPAYVLGMSTYTTGWRSCMRQPDGQYRRGVIHWLLLRGTRVATLLDHGTATYGGVTRRKMRARCLLHLLRDGTHVYDRLYGDPASIEALRTWLHTRFGAISTGEAHTRQPGAKVLGNVRRGRGKPYMDTLQCRPARDDGHSVWVMYV